MLENTTRGKLCKAPEKLLPRLSLRAWKRGPGNAELRVMGAGLEPFLGCACGVLPFCKSAVLPRVHTQAMAVVVECHVGV